MTVRRTTFQRPQLCHSRVVEAHPSAIVGLALKPTALAASCRALRLHSPFSLGQTRSLLPLARTSASVDRCRHRSPPRRPRRDPRSNSSSLTLTGRSLPPARRASLPPSLTAVASCERLICECLHDSSHGLPGPASLADASGLSHVPLHLLLAVGTFILSRAPCCCSCHWASLEEFLNQRSTLDSCAARDLRWLLHRDTNLPCQRPRKALVLKAWAPSLPSPSLSSPSFRTRDRHARHRFSAGCLSSDKRLLLAVPLFPLFSPPPDRNVLGQWLADNRSLDRPCRRPGRRLFEPRERTQVIEPFGWNGMTASLSTGARP